MVSTGSTGNQALWLAPYLWFRQAQPAGTRSFVVFIVAIGIA